MLALLSKWPEAARDALRSNQPSSARYLILSFGDLLSRIDIFQGESRQELLRIGRALYETVQRDLVFIMQEAPSFSPTEIRQMRKFLNFVGQDDRMFSSVYRQITYALSDAAEKHTFDRKGQMHRIEMLEKWGKLFGTEFSVADKAFDQLIEDDIIKYRRAILDQIKNENPMARLN